MSLMENLTDVRSPVSRNAPRLPQLNALTSVRFFAAMHVALFHLVRPFSLWGPLAPVLTSGYVGVSFFFLLSGFILTYSHAAEYERGNASPVRFWVARFARIYPIYLLSMIVAGVTGRQQFHPPIHILAYIADLMMLQSWSVRMVNFFHITAWSLSVEAFFYFVFPFLLLRLRPYTRKQAIGFVVGFWALAMAAPLFYLHVYPQATIGGDPSIFPIGSLAVFRATRLPLLALPEFLAGVSLGWLFLRFRPSASSSVYMAAAGIVALLVMLLFSQHLPFLFLHNGLLIPSYALIILGLSQPNWIARLLSPAWLILLGEASYTLYLIHFMFNDWSMQHLGFDHGLLSAVWKLLVIIPLSLALHIFVERPARRFILQWWGRHYPSPSPVR